jgi:hypothetical protein
VIRNREPILTHGAKAVRAEQKRPHLGHLKDRKQDGNRFTFDARDCLFETTGTALSGSSE